MLDESKIMDEQYWDEAAADFDGEIFDVLANDRKKVILKHIRKLASEEMVACDFGCGTGRLLPALARKFKRVYAADISGECLDIARRACRRFDNIRFFKADLADKKLKLPKAHFGVSINTVIMPSAEIGMEILKTISRHIYRGGTFLLVVPSLESVLYANFRLSQWTQRANGRSSRARKVDWDCVTGSQASIPEGIVDVNGVATKHYLKEGLAVRLESVGFQVKSVQKVEYAWDTEFDRPPRWMKEPNPWDWLVVSEKE